MYWQRNEEFNIVAKGSRNIWDYTWRYNVLINSGLTIIPAKNLIKNIGFTQEATHTSKVDKYSIREIEELNFPLVHPPFMFADKRMDRIYENRFYRRPLLHLTVRITLFLGIYTPVKKVAGSIRKLIQR